MPGKHLPNAIPQMVTNFRFFTRWIFCNQGTTPRVKMSFRELTESTSLSTSSFRCWKGVVWPTLNRVAFVRVRPVSKGFQIRAIWAHVTCLVETMTYCGNGVDRLLVRFLFSTVLKLLWSDPHPCTACAISTAFLKRPFRNPIIIVDILYH